MAAIAPEIEPTLASSTSNMLSTSNGNTSDEEITSLIPEQHKGTQGKYIKSVIYGGLDGIVSVFVAVASVSGTDVSIGYVIILGLSKLVAGAISMGMGDYLGTQADVDFAKRERKREEWECTNFIEGEKKEMVELYTAKGLPVEAATEIVDILSKNPKTFVDVMMVEELGIMPDAEEESPIKNGAVNFVSFVIFGIIPLLVYLAYMGLKQAISMSSIVAFVISIIVTGITLFLMGVVKARLTGTVWWQSAVMTLVFGGLGAAIGWFVSFILTLAFPDVNVSG